jgi:hypothetical protein
LLEKRKESLKDNQPINDDIYLPFSLSIILKPQVTGPFDHAVGRGDQRAKKLGRAKKPEHPV